MIFPPVGFFPVCELLSFHSYQQMAAMQTQTESPVNDTTPIEEPAAAPPGPAAAAAAPEAVVLNAQGGKSGFFHPDAFRFDC